ncbi:protein YbgI [Raoultella ornithinolytica]|nr:protein YbgI [Raoultella ornithinolytica]
MGEIEPLVPWGELSMPVSGLELASWIEARLGRKPLWCGDTGPDKVARVAWCTGGGQSFIDSAARFGVDAFITGEVSEANYPLRARAVPAFLCCRTPCHRTRRYSRVERMADGKYRSGCDFIDIPNPA